LLVLQQAPNKKQKQLKHQQITDKHKKKRYEEAVTKCEYQLGKNCGESREGRGNVS